MSDEQRAPWRYSVVPDGERFAVICAHDKSPDWWHVIARFANKDRADRYAEVEQMMADDNMLEAHKGWDGDEVPAPASLPAEPATGLSVERIRAPSPAERARVGTALVSEAAAAVGARATIQIEKPTDWAQVDTAIRAFWPTEMSVAEMARRCGTTSATVHKHARDMGLPARSTPQSEETPALDPVRGDTIMRQAFKMPPQPLKTVVELPLSKEADDLWLFVSDLDGSVKQSQWSAESGIPMPVLKAATEELVTAGILIRVATGGLTVSALHPKSETARLEVDDESALIEPPTGCPLNAAECAEFSKRWDAGDSMRELADQFNLTTIEVADVRKKLKLPDRVRV